MKKKYVLIIVILLINYLLCSSAISEAAQERVHIILFVKQSGKAAPGCKIRIFDAINVYIKEIICNGSGESDTILPVGNYYFSVLNEEHVSDTQLYSLGKNQNKQAININLKERDIWSYLPGNEIINTITAVLLAYMFFLTRSFRTKKVFFKVFMRGYLRELDNSVAVLERLKKEKGVYVENPSKAKEIYRHLNESVIKGSKVLEELEGKYYDALLQYGQHAFEVIFKNRQMMSDWSALLKTETLNDVHEKVNIIKQSLNGKLFEKKDDETRRIAGLIRRTKCHRLKYKFLLLLYTLIPI